MFGTAPLASLALWTVGVAAVSGVACMVAAVPGMEAAGDVAPDDRWARRMARCDQQRGHGTGMGV